MVQFERRNFSPGKPGVTRRRGTNPKMVQPYVNNMDRRDFTDVEREQWDYAKRILKFENLGSEIRYNLLL